MDLQLIYIQKVLSLRFTLCIVVQHIEECINSNDLIDVYIIQFVLSNIIFKIMYKPVFCVKMMYSCFVCADMLKH